MEVFHQGADSLVEGREVVAAVLEIGAVPVPVAEAHRHAADTRLHQPASHYELVHVHGSRVSFQPGGTPAVAVAKLGTLLLHIQCLQQLAGGQDVEGLLLEAVQTLHQAGAVHVAPEAVEALQQLPAVRKPFQADPVQGHVVSDVPLRLEGSVGHAQEAGSAEVVFAVAGLVGQVDVGWNGRVGRTLQLGEHRSQFRPASRRRTAPAAADAPGHALVGGV